MTQYRKDKLVNNHVYHVFTRSIAKFVVFNDFLEYDRMYQLLNHYRYRNFTYKLSQFEELSPASQVDLELSLKLENDSMVSIIAYCLMPTHIHIILKQTVNDGISKFMGRVLNGYSRYFNTKHRRTGPLWSGRFKNVLASNDEQLLHLTRYVHLNPSSAGLVNKPEDWKFSSYQEYIDRDNKVSPICDFKEIVDLNATDYRKFANNNKDYQKQLSLIKYLMLDNYSG